MNAATSLSERAIHRAGLWELLQDRLLASRADAARRALAERLSTGAPIDVLLLGSMADRVRAAERGDVARVYLDRHERGGEELVFGPGYDAEAGGIALMRRVAVARLTSSGASSLVVDVETIGIQLAQLALAFGADAWIAPIAHLRLEVMEADDDHDGELAQLGAGRTLLEVERAILKEREIAALIRAAKRRPRFVVRGVERDVDETTVVKRKFRAPGREVAAQRDADGVR